MHLVNVWSMISSQSIGNLLIISPDQFDQRYKLLYKANLPKQLC